MLGVSDGIQDNAKLLISPWRGQYLHDLAAGFYKHVLRMCVFGAQRRWRSLQRMTADEKSTTAQHMAETGVSILKSIDVIAVSRHVCVGESASNDRPIERNEVCCFNPLFCRFHTTAQRPVSHGPQSHLWIQLPAAWLASARETRGPLLSVRGRRPQVSGLHGSVAFVAPRCHNLLEPLQSAPWFRSRT